MKDRRWLNLAVVLLIVAAAWWLSQRSGTDEPASPSSSQPAAVSTSTPGGSATPTGTPTPTQTGTPTADGSIDPETGLTWVALDTLPPEAAETLALIDAGGPFPYPDDDGKTFLNIEGLLPDHDRGYYREYTVPTPGADTRGARRIITGSGGELFWTDDHYQSFERIAR